MGSAATLALLTLALAQCWAMRTPLVQKRAPPPCAFGPGVPKSKIASFPAYTGTPDFCYGLPGNIAPLGNWDPVGFTYGASKEQVYFLREAEITHCRVGMLAAAGFFVQEFFHPLFGGNAGGSFVQEEASLPPAMWLMMTLGIGWTEALRVQKGWANPYEVGEGEYEMKSLKPGYYPGDLGWDPLRLFPEDEVEQKKMREREISNGRLAMLAAAGFLMQEAVTGTSWGAADNVFTRFLHLA